jgi:hypothetical protein
MLSRRSSLLQFIGRNYFQRILASIEYLIMPVIGFIDAAQAACGRTGVQQFP